MNQLVDYFTQGGPLMWPLLLCSILALAFIIERAVRLRRARLLDPTVIEDIQSAVERGEIEKAIDRHRNSPVLIGQILVRALTEYTTLSVDIETAVSESASRGLRVLTNNLGVLALVAKVAPLLGLLGTVQGMILGFEELEMVGVGKEKLAGAIRVALLTTAAGLGIAIPTIVAAAFFRGRIRRLQAEFEEVLIDFVKSVKVGQARRLPLPSDKP